MGEPVGYTCPQIDEVIGFLKERAKEKEAILGALGECSKESADEFESICDLMEDLRTANDKLRMWGRDSEERVDELEEELSDLGTELDLAKEEIKGLQEELGELNGECDAGQ